MADYKAMYHTLLIEMNDTIERFQKKLLEAEDIYIAGADPIIVLMDVSKESEAVTHSDQE